MTTLGFTAAHLRPLTDYWAIVARILGVKRIEAVTIVDRLITEHAWPIYAQDPDTGLWGKLAWGGTAEEALSELRCCDYAQRFYNDENTADDVVDIDIRLLEEHLSKLLAKVEEISQAVPADCSSSDVGPGVRSTSTDDLENKHQRIKAKSRDLIVQFMDHNYPTYAKLACQSLLGIAENENTVPLYPQQNFGSHERKIWGDVAEATLNNLYKLSRAGESESPSNPGDSTRNPPNPFLSAKDWISNDYSPDNVFSFQFTNRQLDELVRNPSPYFSKLEDGFGCSIGRFCELVYHGIPLYMHDGESVAPLPIPYCDDEYIYLMQKGKLFDWKPESQYPFWALKYLVRRDHLEVYRMFFGNDASTPDEATVSIRRSAFRQQIGFPTITRLSIEPASNGTLANRKGLRESDISRKNRTYEQLVLAFAIELGWDKRSPEKVINRSGRKVDLPAVLERHFGAEAISDDTIRNTLKEALADLQDIFIDQLKR